MNNEILPMIVGLYDRVLLSLDCREFPHSRVFGVNFVHIFVRIFYEFERRRFIARI